jgi:OOP family OmpA-OmpF porin
MGADLGKASYSNTNVPPAGGFAATTFANPGMIRIAGGYHFSPMLAAEIDYAKFGDSTLSYAGVGDATLAMHSVQIAAVGTYPLNPQFDLIGKLGFSSNTEKLTGTGSFSTLNSSNSKTDLLIGIGAQYNLTSNASIRLQYEDFGKFDNYSEPVKASVFSLGITSNF